MKKHKNDILLLICLAVFSVSALIVFSHFKKEGAAVYVTVDGKTVAEYSLDSDASVRIGNNDCGNTLVIESGTAYITNATCPDKICERKKIRYNGESLVCLPNKTVVTIKGAAESETDF